MLDQWFLDLAEHRQVDRPTLLVMRDWRREGLRCALLTIVAIDGRSPRSVGAQMVVNEKGGMHGYLTGGCLEGELALVGRQAIENGENKLLRYGKDSPFIDMKLPCGSGVDIFFDRGLDDAVLFEAAGLMEERKFFSLFTDLGTGVSKIMPMSADMFHVRQENEKDGVFSRLCKPSIHLNLYGAGIAAVQIAYFASLSGIGLTFYAGDEITMSAAKAMGLEALDMNASPFQIPKGDLWTASMLAFHEHEREIPLLAQMTDGPDFYLGTIGSALVARQRVEALKQCDVSDKQIARINMSAGLVGGARSATELAVGVVAEILNAARQSGLRS